MVSWFKDTSRNNGLSVSERVAQVSLQEHHGHTDDKLDHLSHIYWEVGLILSTPTLIIIIFAGQF